MEFRCITLTSFLVAVLWMSGVVLTAHRVYNSTQDYCDKSLCHGERHVACVPKTKSLMTLYGKSCAIYAQWNPLEGKKKELILDLMNDMRNKVAHGKFDGFLPAARMATLQWDNELEHVAVYNVIMCRLHQDKCRNTAKYKRVGQTVAFRAGGPSMEKAIKSMLKLWFKERSSATMEDIHKYKGKGAVLNSNFMQLVLEKGDRVGCAIMMHYRFSKYQYFFTCNYARRPKAGQSVYTPSGVAGDACQTGKHSDYESLCSVRESYDNGMIGTQAEEKTDIGNNTPPEVARRSKNDNVNGKEVEIHPNNDYGNEAYIERFNRMLSVLQRAQKRSKLNVTHIKTSMDIPEAVEESDEKHTLHDKTAKPSHRKSQKH